MKDTYNLIYEDLIFRHNLNLLFEEVNYLHSIINEDNFWDSITSICDKIGEFFEASFDIFTKGYEAVVDFCKQVFQLTHIKDLMNKLGLSDNILLKFVSIVKSSLIVIPIAKIGYGVVERTYKDIQGNDVAILIDREAYNKKTSKLFNEQTFLEKCWTIFKTGSKALVCELFSSIPLILRCITGYAIASGFEEAINDPKFLTEAQQKTFAATDAADKVLAAKRIERDENGKIIPGSNYYSQEKSMAVLNTLHSQANCGPGTLNKIVRSEKLGAWFARQPDGSVENVYGIHNNKTNHGIADLINGTRTTFKTDPNDIDVEKLVGQINACDPSDTDKLEKLIEPINGKYVEEKLSPTEFGLELTKQCGVPIGGNRELTQMMCLP